MSSLDSSATASEGAEPARQGESTEPAPKSRAGRNLPVAIGVGVSLGGVVAASLFIWRFAFLVILAAFVVVGTWEMIRAVRSAGIHVPLTPLMVGGPGMVALAAYGGVRHGPEALAIGLALTVASLWVWRLADGPVGYLRDVTVATFVAVYVPFLGGFAALLLAPSDGAVRVTAAIAAVVLSDTGGYAAGVLFGKHPMAPSVSPKKSWEGFAGSVAAAALGSALLLALTLDTPWWAGLIFGAVLAAVATLGDLGESLLKRDLGIKDMGTVLPGHGGVMDRLDSLLLAAPVGFLLLSVFAPSTG